MPDPHAQPDNPASLPIAETFTSVQGEGRLTGTRSWFVRTSGCNLRCAWCDTPYASWRPESQRRTIADLTAEAASAHKDGVRHAVVTGGEPMMFAAVVPLTRALQAAGLHVTIETAGTVLPPPGPPAPRADQVHADLMSISPKLSTSTPTPDQARAGDIDAAWPERHDSRRLNVPVLQQLLDQWGPGRRQLKFVVTGERDLDEIDAILSRLHNWSNDDILLMPEGVTVPTQERRAWLQSLCAERHWTYCPRLHIELFGNVRGT